MLPVDTGRTCTVTSHQTSLLPWAHGGVRGVHTLTFLSEPIPCPTAPAACSCLQLLDTFIYIPEKVGFMFPHLPPSDLTRMPQTLPPFLVWRRILTWPPSFVANVPSSVPWSTLPWLAGYPWPCRPAPTNCGGCSRRPSTKQKLGSTVASAAQLGEWVLFLSSASASVRNGAVTYSHVVGRQPGVLCAVSREGRNDHCTLRTTRYARIRGFHKEKNAHRTILLPPD